MKETGNARPPSYVGRKNSYVPRRFFCFPFPTTRHVDGSLLFVHNSVGLGKKMFRGGRLTFISAFLPLLARVRARTPLEQTTFSFHSFHNTRKLIHYQSLGSVSKTRF